MGAVCAKKDEIDLSTYQAEEKKPEGRKDFRKVRTLRSARGPCGGRLRQPAASPTQTTVPAPPPSRTPPVSNPPQQKPARQHPPPTRSLEPSPNPTPPQRNSLVFHMVDWVEKEDVPAMLLKIRARGKKKEPLPDWTKMDPRTMRQAKIAEEIACGNMRTMREQVIGHFSTINRKYQGGWGGDSLLHIVCREGYYHMAEFMSNPKNYSAFDATALDYDAENNKWRAPLHVLFTPTHESFLGRKYGLQDSGKPKAVKPEGIQVETDWIKPGGETERHKIIELFIEKGADIHKLDFHDYSIFHYACLWGWVETAKLLLENGADAEAGNAIGQNPFTVSVEYKWLEIVEFLLENTTLSLETKNSEGETALFYAVRNSDLDMTQALCEFGCNVNVASYDKLTPLKIACQSQAVEIVGVLLDFKATQRPSAFDLLEGRAKGIVNKRLEDEKQRKREEAEKHAKDKRRAGGGLSATWSSGGKSEYGAWKPYIDKKDSGVFYYNTVSRVCQRERPEDYTPDLRYSMKTATYGMHFYH